MTSCFGGTSAVDFQGTGMVQEIDIAYDRLQSEGEEKEGSGGGEDRIMEEIRGTIQLGKKPSSLSKRTMRSLSFSNMMRSENNKGMSLASKVKGACEQVLDAAKKGSPHINELFVGNQLFLMQVTSSSLSRRSSKLSPSAGLLHNSARLNADYALRER